jgi:glutathione S-transferase
MALTLYHNDVSVCAQKVRLCLAEKALAYEDKSQPACRRPEAA